MPALSRITNTFFTNLINRLGVRPPPPEGFELVNVVQPVSIVDTDVPFTSLATTQLLNVPFTAGALLTPAAGTVLADIGPQAAGNYNIYVILSLDGGSNTNPTFQVARRNAANVADIWAFYASISSGTAMTLPLIWSARVTLVANERIVVRVGALGLAAGTVQANIWLTAA